MTTPPKWTDARKHQRSEGRAARVVALYITQQRGEWPDAPKTRIAAALGITRWTLDRDLASVQELAERVAEFRAQLAELQSGAIPAHPLTKP